MEEKVTLHLENVSLILEVNVEYLLKILNQNGKKEEKNGKKTVVEMVELLTKNLDKINENQMKILEKYSNTELSKNYKPDTLKPGWIAPRKKKYSIAVKKAELPWDFYCPQKNVKDVVVQYPRAIYDYLEQINS